MANKKVIYAKPRGKDKRRYHWYPDSGGVHRAPVGVFFDPSEKKIGTAKTLEDAIALIKSNEGGSAEIDIA